MFKVTSWMGSRILPVIPFIFMKAIVLFWQAARRSCRLPAWLCYTCRQRVREYCLTLLAGVKETIYCLDEDILKNMRLPFLKQPPSSNTLTLYIKCGSIFLLFLFSVLVVACGSNASGVGLGQPPVTVTINLNGNSPTPSLQPYYCTTWVTSTTPGINNGGIVPVYAKFVQMVSGNPQGVDQASAVANVAWPDGNTATVNATTTADGLAVFAVSTANRGADVGRFTFVTVTFSKPGVPSCAVTGNQAAFFVLSYVTPTVTTSPTVVPTVTPTPCGVQPGNIPNIPLRKTPTPTPPPTPSPTPSPTPCG